MVPTTSVRRFDEQFARQVREGDLRLNPFEAAALPYLSGRVLDYGCGLGNLAVAAARRGCTVVALDASAEAVGHLRRAAAELAQLIGDELNHRFKCLDRHIDAAEFFGDRHHAHW